MDSAHTSWPSNREYLEQFDRKAALLRVPVSGSIDLTHRCNLRCVHCYVSPQSDRKELQKGEMETERLLSIIDEVADAGCLNLLITGGEPLIRKDFAEIYTHAKLKGMLVTVFTNATMITDSILALFKDLPPHMVEITLYGATAATYERVTGVHGSFERCLSGISRLLEHKVHVALKTILMTLNRHEFPDMQNMAKDFGVKFRFDAAIFPRLNGDRSPLSLRVSPEEAVEMEFLDEEMAGQWEDYFQRCQGIPLPETLYNCGAGIMSFHIDPYGMLKPCLMTGAPEVNLLTGSFATGWREVIPRVREKKAGIDFVCARCESQLLCGYCPAFFALENSSEDIHSAYLCAMGKQRFQRIHNNRLKENSDEERRQTGSN